MNQPYVKQINSLGVVTNPITGSYINQYPNRKERRIYLQKDRFHGESKNRHLIIVKTNRFTRQKQYIKLKDEKGVYTGEVRVIKHLLN